MTSSHTHPKDCPDQKAAAVDRKRREAALAQQEQRQQLIAHAEWFDWYPASQRK